MFDFARDRLCGKLHNKVQADSIIGGHFHMATMTADQEVRRVVSNFRLPFSNIGYKETCNCTTCTLYFVMIQHVVLLLMEVL